LRLSDLLLLPHRLDLELLMLHQLHRLHLLHQLGLLDQLHQLDQLGLRLDLQDQSDRQDPVALDP
jgi:hypothetical protein